MDIFQNYQNSENEFSSESVQLGLAENQTKLEQKIKGVKEQLQNSQELNRKLQKDLEKV